MEYLNHLSLKCDHPLSCEFPILFSRKKVKLGHTFSQLIHKFNIWILKCWSGAVYISKFFSNHKEMGNWDFWKVSIAFPNFPQFIKKFENWNFCPFTFIFGQIVRAVFQYDDMWHQIWSKKGVSILLCTKVLFPQVDEGFWLAILH